MTTYLWLMQQLDITEYYNGLFWLENEKSRTSRKYIMGLNTPRLSKMTDEKIICVSSFFNE